VLWMTRTSLILQFCSLWLLTPTIIGEEKMEKARISVNKRLKMLEARGRKVWNSGIVRVAGSIISSLAGLAILGVISYYLFDSGRYYWGWIKWDLIIGGALTGVCLALIIIITVFYGLTWALGRWLGYATKSAHNMLGCGAVLFTMGIILAFIATW
jgi:hypothetical protein